MDSQQAIDQMQAAMDCARRCARNGLLQPYMRGYIDGKIAAFAEVAGTTEANELLVKMDHEMLSIATQAQVSA